jgi:hypothetical protein
MNLKIGTVIIALFMFAGAGPGSVRRAPAPSR